MRRSETERDRAGLRVSEGDACSDLWHICISDHIRHELPTRRKPIKWSCQRAGLRAAALTEPHQYLRAQFWHECHGASSVSGVAQPHEGGPGQCESLQPVPGTLHGKLRIEMDGLVGA